MSAFRFVCQAPVLQIHLSPLETQRTIEVGQAFTRGSDMDGKLDACKELREYYDQLVAQKARIDELIRLADCVAFDPSVASEKEELIKLTCDLSDKIREVVDRLDVFEARPSPNEVPRNYRRSTD